MNSFFQWLADLFKGVKCWTIILPWEQGLRVRLGRWTRLLPPGPHLRIPFLDQVRTVNTRLRVAPIPIVTVTLKDGKTTVNVGGIIAFRLVDPLKVLLTCQQPEDLASAITQAAMAECLASTDRYDLSVGTVEKHALAILRESRLEGFEFDYVRITDFAIVRTYRLLMEQWRPSTGMSNLEPLDSNGRPI